jgi:transcription-repair coupling factor (superfamily II helicase)
MEFLNKILSSDPDFKLLLKDIEAGRLPVACTGLSDVHKAVVIKSSLFNTNKKGAVLTSDEATALKITADLKSLGLNAVNFPLRDYCLQNLTGHSKEYEHKRTDTLSALADGAFDVVCFSVDSALQYTVPPEI